MDKYIYMIENWNFFLQIISILQGHRSNFSPTLHTRISWGGIIQFNTLVGEELSPGETLLLFAKDKETQKQINFLLSLSQMFLLLLRPPIIKTIKQIKD